ncbi:hypothetical protein MSG28_014272 [Choristoneura fumiferana]|uniref:Uncharacterized protein n=1 Tax=Choristoneura fumiferana TaxID=7141 RepID=A0ACC0JGJ9_CHOFU|nr:hypothetical protein MSG28_014272 [Choristoneura fumiferana]
MSLNIKFNKEGARSVGEADRQLKIVPILGGFVLLKAMTLILWPSVSSFTQIAADNTHPQIATHGPWDAAYAATRHRRDAEPQEIAQELAYNAYH